MTLRGAAIALRAYAATMARAAWLRDRAALVAWQDRRMPYVISEQERFIWLGTILAKSLGLAALKRPRVAVALPQGSAFLRCGG